jgi:acetyltransferase-like isoleucine patch superfamily enzyme
MLFGIKHKGKYLAKTRISTSTFIDHPANLDIGDNVHIGHHNFIEASNGITIEEGCQITNFISITTHSSHIAIRLYGDHYTNVSHHDGYLRGKVHIGKYTFIGPYTLIMPETRIGKGCLVHAYSNVKGDVPDFSVIAGNPAKVIGDTREIDKPYLEKHPELKTWYDQWVKSQP